jgi:hypothetical protein
MEIATPHTIIFRVVALCVSEWSVWIVGQLDLAGILTRLVGAMVGSIQSPGRPAGSLALRSRPLPQGRREADPAADRTGPLRG